MALDMEVDHTDVMTTVVVDMADTEVDFSVSELEFRRSQSQLTKHTQPADVLVQDVNRKFMLFMSVDVVVVETVTKKSDQLSSNDR